MPPAPGASAHGRKAAACCHRHGRPILTPSSHTRTRAPEVTPASSDRCSLRLAGYEDVNAWQLAREAAMRVNVGRGGSIVPPLQAPQPSTWARSRSSLARGAKADHRALGVINR